MPDFGSKYANINIHTNPPKYSPLFVCYINILTLMDAHIKQSQIMGSEYV